MGDNDGDPKVPDLPPEKVIADQLTTNFSNLPSRGVLTFASYSIGLGGLALLAWVLFQLFVCGCA